MPSHRSKKTTTAEPTPAVQHDNNDTVSEIASEIISDSQPTDTQDSASAGSGRRRVTRESILDDFDALIERLTEIETAVKATGFGTFQSPRDLRRPFTETIKSVQRLRRNCESKLRKTISRQPTTNTGLNRKLTIKPEFADWVGIDANVEYSRMDINRLWKTQIGPRINNRQEYDAFCEAVGVLPGGSPMTYRKFQHMMKRVFV